MPSGILRVLAFLAAAGVIAAATHANVLHAGGYGSQDAPLIITLAVLLALGMAFVGVCFNEVSADSRSCWRSSFSPAKPIGY